MLLHVFASETTSAGRNGSLIYVEEATEKLPPHPKGGEWRYVATMEDEHLSPASLRTLILAGIALHGFYVSMKRSIRPF